jgi:hypothetical protein
MLAAKPGMPGSIFTPARGTYSAGADDTYNKHRPRPKLTRSPFVGVPTQRSLLARLYRIAQLHPLGKHRSAAVLEGTPAALPGPRPVEGRSDAGGAWRQYRKL